MDQLHTMVGDAIVTCETTCPKPTNTIIQEITQNTANFSWAVEGMESNWIIEYGEKGFFVRYRYNCFFKH